MTPSTPKRTPDRRRPRSPWLLAWALVGLSLGVAAAPAPSVLEVRALYLYNFSLFIEWPTTAFESKSQPLEYCVAGNHKLHQILGKLLAGETAGGRPLHLKPVEHRQWRNCHLLYLDRSLGEERSKILDQVQGAPVLTVGDSRHFVVTGGMVALVRKGRRVRPVVDLAAVKAVGIRISSKLLRLSELIDGREEGRP